MHGMEERRIPGNTLAVQPDKPYQGLSMFGTGFLSRCALAGHKLAARTPAAAAACCSLRACQGAGAGSSRPQARHAR